jgi:[ribosomal protein S18]-alanine N-acetyltransferase
MIESSMMRHETDAPLDPNNISLLWASPDRVGDIAALHARLFDPPWDDESITQLVEHPAAAAFVAQVREPKSLAGFIIGQIAADEAEILSVGVAPEWQRRGIARHMIEGLTRAARLAEVKRLFLEAAADNTAAIKLYNSLGFTAVGSRKDYYRRPNGQPVDAVVLALTL